MKKIYSSGYNDIHTRLAVHYMVENSLGRLWLEGHPDVKEQLLPTEEELSVYAVGNRDPEDTKWHYYLEEAEQEPEIQAQLAEICKEYAALTPDQLKVIDHAPVPVISQRILFDVLIKIYESYGYTTREAVASIVENTFTVWILIIVRHSCLLCGNDESPPV